jgi:hypothetical protein
LSSYRREHGQARFKCVLPFLVIAKPGEPGQSPAGVRNSQDRNRLFHAQILPSDSCVPGIRRRPKYPRDRRVGGDVGRDVTTDFTGRSAGVQGWLYGAAPIVRHEEGERCIPNRAALNTVHGQATIASAAPRIAENHPSSVAMDEGAGSRAFGYPMSRRGARTPDLTSSGAERSTSSRIAKADISRGGECRQGPSRMLGGPASSFRYRDPQPAIWPNGSDNRPDNSEYEGNQPLGRALVLLQARTRQDTQEQQRV